MTYKTAPPGKETEQGAITSRAVFVCSGILGKLSSSLLANNNKLYDCVFQFKSQGHVSAGQQCTAEHRSMPGLQAYSGYHMFAGKDQEAKNYLVGQHAKDKASHSIVRHL